MIKPINSLSINDINSFVFINNTIKEILPSIEVSINLLIGIFLLRSRSTPRKVHMLSIVFITINKSTYMIKFITSVIIKKIKRKI